MARNSRRGTLDQFISDVERKIDELGGSVEACDSIMSANELEELGWKEVPERITELDAILNSQDIQCSDDTAPWNNAYREFNKIVDKYIRYGEDEINRRVEELYLAHRDDDDPNYDWEEAWWRWNNIMTDEDIEGSDSLITC